MGKTNDKTAKATNAAGSKSKSKSSPSSPSSSSSTMTTETLLSQLVTSLATGARSVQNLPLGDDFEYHNSFPEFTKLLETTQHKLLKTIQRTIEQTTTTIVGSASSPDDDVGGVSSNSNNISSSLISQFSELLGGGGENDDFLSTMESLDDPMLWETCTDLCDALLEQAEATIASSWSSSGTAIGGSGSTSTPGNPPPPLPKGHRVLQGIVDMDKPQDVYKFGGGRSNNNKNNDREQVFIPPFIRRKFFAKTPLDLTTLEPGHGIDTKNGESKSRNMTLPSSTSTSGGEQPEIVAPSQHLPHIYQDELQALKKGSDDEDNTHSYPSWVFDVVDSTGTSSSTPPPNMKFERTPTNTLLQNAIWIDTLEDLQELSTLLQKGTTTETTETRSDDGGVDTIKTLKNEPFVKEIAIDLEAHSYRTFAGMICLIQMSFEVPVVVLDDDDDDDSRSNRVERKDYLIDPFPIWDHIHDALAPTLANPKIVKIFHGADSDVSWLQRDFGLYVVNMFDTGRAARALQLPSFGFAFLLEKYVDGIEKADKTHQLSDWRQRPLPASMKEYAILDTHYLLRIYRALKYELSQSKRTSIEEVLEESRKVCTIRYVPDAFRPNGYKSIMATKRKGRSGRQTKSRSQTDLTGRQEEVLKRLWDWRDQVARQNDESCMYVCSNTALLRLAMGCPTNLSKMQSLLQPMPPLVLRNAKNILDLIQTMETKGTSNAVNKDRSTAAIEKITGQPFDKISSSFGEAGLELSNNKTNADNAGSDDEIAEIITSSSEDEGNDDLKQTERTRRRRGLIFHKGNNGHFSQCYTNHSLQLLQSRSAPRGNRIGIIDGLGTVLVTHSAVDSIKKALDDAKTISSKIHSEGEIRGIPGLSYTSGVDFDDANKDTEMNDHHEFSNETLVEEENEEEFKLPKTVRQTYRDSSSWNRTTKKKGIKRETDSNEALSNDQSTQKKDEDKLDSKKEEKPKTDSPKKTIDYSKIGSIGAFAIPKSASSTTSNPFFAGAALQGGYLNKQFASGGPPTKKRPRDDTGGASESGKKKNPRQQIERPEKRSEGRSQAYRPR